MDENDQIKTTYVAFGGNQGDVREYFRHAKARLAAAASNPVRMSSLYQTAPVGVEDQPPFLNAVLEMNWRGTSRELLSLCLAVERECGRDRRHEERWGPRTLDLDVLLVGDETIESDELTVPHPRMAERAFVLVPLVELSPELVPPGSDQSIFRMLANLGDPGDAVVLAEPSTL